MADADSYVTLARPVRHEIPRIKGSRFVAYAAPVASRSEALAVVEAERELHADARHHCFAWRLGAGGRDERSNDADEPAGSAGAPILRQMQGRELEGAVVVVTRWFGGTKLGVGGLVRAYGGAAGAALDAGELVRRPHLATLRLRHAYGASGLVESLLRAHHGEALGGTYESDVVQTVRVPLAVRDRFVEEFTDGTSGRGRVEDVVGGEG
ncbi:MAG: YigZ family protein [Planctomycetota bacterium]